MSPLPGGPGGPESDAEEPQLPSFLVNGNQRVEIYREVAGPTDYVQGSGADMVPRAIGDGQVHVHVSVMGHPSALADASTTGEILFTVEGLKAIGVSAVQQAVELSLSSGREVTRASIFALVRTVAG